MMQKQKYPLVGHILGGHIIYSVTKTATQNRGRRRKSFSDVCGVFGVNGAGEIARLYGVNEKSFHLPYKSHNVRPHIPKSLIWSARCGQRRIIEMLVGTAKVAADLDNEDKQEMEVI